MWHRIVSYKKLNGKQFEDLGDIDMETSWSGPVTWHMQKKVTPPDVPVAGLARAAAAPAPIEQAAGKATAGPERSCCIGGKCS